MWLACGRLINDVLIRGCPVAPWWQGALAKEGFHTVQDLALLASSSPYVQQVQDKIKLHVGDWVRLRQVAKTLPQPQNKVTAKVSRVHAYGRASSRSLALPMVWNSCYLSCRRSPFVPLAGDSPQTSLAEYMAQAGLAKETQVGGWCSLASRH